MNTKNKVLIKLVYDIVKLRKELAELSERERELKANLKAFMGKARLLEASEYCVLIETRTRTDLDKEALAQALGPGILKKYQHKTEFDIMTIRPIKTG